MLELRGRRRMLLSLALLAATAGLATIALFVASLGDWALIPLFAVVVLGAGVGETAVMAPDHPGRYCPTCHYDVRGLGSSAACPECGKEIPATIREAAAAADEAEGVYSAGS